MNRRERGSGREDVEVSVQRNLDPEVRIQHEVSKDERSEPTRPCVVLEKPSHSDRGAQPRAGEEDLGEKLVNLSEWGEDVEERAIAGVFLNILETLGPRVTSVHGETPLADEIEVVVPLPRQHGSRDRCEG